MNTTKAVRAFIVALTILDLYLVMHILSYALAV